MTLPAGAECQRRNSAPLIEPTDWAEMGIFLTSVFVGSVGLALAILWRSVHWRTALPLVLAAFGAIGFMAVLPDLVLGRFSEETQEELLILATACVATVWLLLAKE